VKIEKVSFISAELPYWNLVTHAVFPEYGMPLVATIVRDAGYDVRAFVEHIGPIQWDMVLESDVVCFHAFSSTMPKTIEYINKIKAARPEMPIIIGGTHASVMSEDTLQYCDVVVRKEGDETLPELLKEWQNGGDLSNILGITYWDNGRVRNNPDRPFTQDFETIPDLELIHGYMNWPRWKLIRKLKMRWQLIQTSRGCPYDCSFCIAPRELGRGYRLRSIDSIIADIKYQQKLVGSKYFFMVDNHFTVNRQRTKDLLNRIIEEKIDWYGICFTRMEVARDEELLSLLKKAQINTLYMGLESFDNNVLKLLNKAQTQEGLRKSLEKIKAHGLRVLGSFVMGSDEDTVESIRSTIDSAIEVDIDYTALFPLSGYPEYNSPNIKINRFFLPTWDRLDGTFVMFLPKNMKPSTLQREINRAYKKFYSPRQVLRRLAQGDIWCALKRIAYGYWAWEIRRSTSTWIKYLESVEDPYYDENEHLIEENLSEEGIHPAKYPGSTMAAGLEKAAITMGGD
jgi:anaerobic magnesium-protoporphyrin IX monomethyl ester cyclase